MSGTSLDGLDIALCTFEKKDSKVTYSIESAYTVDYTPELKEQLTQVMSGSAFDIVALDRSLGRYFGEQVRQFLSQTQFPVDAIASHGHTVFHQPDKGITLQIGHPAELYAATQIPVIGDFRCVDVALGGQGAPLVPIGDQLLFSSYPICINIGGISNLSIKKPNGAIVAYDIGAANMILNYLSQKIGLAYDKDGAVAAQGILLPEVATALQSISYYQLQGPKSLGREYIERHYIHLLDTYLLQGLSVQDLLHTCTHHIALQLARTIKNERNHSSDTILLTGGGALNTYLMDCLKGYMKDDTLTIPSKEIILFKEALIFAYLGYLFLIGETNTLAQVTGARRDSIGGALYGGLGRFLLH
jgi:anhydro-N-acetylmuramic acid kinase